jgi:hypothetical protein
MGPDEILHIGQLVKIALLTHTLWNNAVIDFDCLFSIDYSVYRTVLRVPSALW